MNVPDMPSNRGRRAATIGTMEDHVRGSVLVVDDEPTITEVVARYLNRAGYATRVAANGREALDAAATQRPDLVVLDLMLPGIDGLEVMRRLRDQDRDRVAVILLTAKSEESDRVIGLRLGADDYVVKPFSIEELLARVHAVLRRTAPPEKPPASLLTVADLELDEDSHEVRRAGLDVQLTPTEFELLRYLMRNERVVLSKSQILERVWKYDFQGRSNIVELYVGYLRKKVDSVEPHLIHTIRGVGYVLRAPR
jgi:two-component system OmpR family response regulator